MPSFHIRDASAFSELHKVETSYTMADMVAALQSCDSDCGFVGEFLDKICGRENVYCDCSEFSSFQHDVLSFEVEYYDQSNRLRYMEIRVLEAA